MSANLNRAILALDTLKPIAKALPVAGQYLEGVFDLLALACRHANDVKANKEDMTALAERAVRCVAVIVEKAQDMPQSQIADRMSTIRELGDLTEVLVQKAKKQAERSHISRTWRKSDDKEVIDSLSRRFGEVIERLGIEAQLLAAYGNESILDQVKKLADGQKKTEQTALLDKLRPVAAVRHDYHKAPRGCTENTRVGIIDRIIRWISDVTTLQNIFWLSGLAGTGKTAIMRTLSERLTELGVLGGSFFVSVTSADRQDPIKIIHTLVYQLAWMQPLLREPICNVIRNRPYVLDQAMTSQIPALLSDPFGQILDKISKPIVILIDALDECEKVNGVEGGEFLPTLLSAMRQHPGKLKLVVTSRLNPSLRKLFTQAAVDRFMLHEIEKETVDGDLRLYLQAELEKITQSRDLENDRPWYTSEDITEIITHAGSLFIYVFTVVKWVSSLQFMPEDRLQQVLRWRQAVESKSPFQVIDDLYSAMLQNALGSDPSNHKEVGERIHKLLEILVVAFEPLSIPALAQVLGCDEKVVRLDLENLSAVTPVPERGTYEPVVIYHASFLDYLTDEKRCSRESPFHVSVGQAHGRMGTYCQDLVYNQRYSGQDRSNVYYGSELQSGLSYAHRWKDHLERSPHSSEFISKAMQKAQQVVSRNREDVEALDDLSHLLYIQSYRTSEIETLHEKITVDRRLIDLRPPSHPGRASSLNNLSTGLQLLYERNGDEQVLNEKIRLDREALELRPPGHPLRDHSLNNLGVGLQLLYERNGDEQALNEGVRLDREALELCPPGHPLREYSLNSLGVGLQFLYQRNGDEQVLNEKVRLDREALELRPPGHPLRDYSLNNLGVGLQLLYERNGDEQALNEKVRLDRETLELCPLGHPLRSLSLNSLAIGLRLLYECSGDEQDLIESVRLHREELKLRPCGHFARHMSLIEFATTLCCWYKGNRDQALLNEAIELNREALKICPSRHPLYHMSKNGLSLLLYLLYERSGEIAIVEEGVQLGKDALSLCPNMHPKRPYYLRTLSNSLKAYGQALGDQSLIYESDQLRKEADMWSLQV